jgi:2'-5' RNA ligase
MTDTTTTHAQSDHVRNHWWWRPGWHRGQRFYTWHLTFEHQPVLHRLVGTYQRELASLRALDLIPRRWLHLTMQGVGFVDDIERDQVDQLVLAAQARLAALRAPEITFDRPLVRPEAVVLPASPAESVIAIRDAIRDAFDDTDLGDAPEPRDGFLPHVSLAYVNHDGPADPIITALAHAHPEPATIEVRSAALIVLDRDARMYQWRNHAAAPLAVMTEPAASPSRRAH